MDTITIAFTAESISCSIIVRCSIVAITYSNF